MTRPSERTPAVLVAFLALLAAPVAHAAEGATYEYTFAWEERAEHASAHDGETAEGETTEVAAAVPHANLTVVRFLLTWTDDVGAADTLSLRVVGPDGAEHGPENATAKEGAVEVLVRPSELPPGTVTLRAGSDDEAWSTFGARYPGHAAGRGTWTAHVTVDHAGDGDGILPDADGGNAWRLQVDVAYAVATLQSRVEVPPDAPPATPPPTEMPPPDPEPEAPPATGPDPEPKATGGLLALPGVRSLLLVAAAALGVGAALALGRRADRKAAK